MTALFWETVRVAWPGVSDLVVLIKKVVVTGEPEGDGGTEPDARFTFANERTFLAWSRTALALIAGGLAVSQLLKVGSDVARWSSRSR